MKIRALTSKTLRVRVRVRVCDSFLVEQVIGLG
jgi:hypothetical protein